MDITARARILTASAMLPGWFRLAVVAGAIAAGPGARCALDGRLYERLAAEADTVQIYKTVTVPRYL